MIDYDDAIVKISEIFSDLKIPSVVVGASARDIFCKKFSLPPAIRKTSDVDFGIFVKNWDELKKVEERLKNNKKIEKKGEKDNKVRYHYNGTPFDIVPFGGIEKDNKVSWPPFYDTIMTVLGYEEALEKAVKIEINSVEINVVCVEILIALKLIAWGENPTRQRDIQDSWYLISNYNKIDPAAYEYVMDHYFELLEKYEFAPEYAEPVLVGIKMKKLLGKKSLDVITSLLNDQKILERISIVALEGKFTEEKDQEMLKVQKFFEAILTGIL
jgi:predicted nucleotidyltransferase